MTTAEKKASMVVKFDMDEIGDATDWIANGVNCGDLGVEEIGQFIRAMDNNGIGIWTVKTKLANGQFVSDVKVTFSNHVEGVLKQMGYDKEAQGAV